MLKPFLLLAAVILFELVPTPATGGMPQATPPAPAASASTNPVKPTAASQDRAKKIYAMDCAICHGDNGNGKNEMEMTPGDWTDPKTLAAKSDQELFDAIRKGKGEKMPPEDVARAKNDEVWNLVIYIRAMSKGQPAQPPKPGN
jgi:mono/diheme cytochrome c family protein